MTTEYHKVVNIINLFHEILGGGGGIPWASLPLYETMVQIDIYYMFVMMYVWMFVMMYVCVCDGVCLC